MPYSTVIDRDTVEAHLGDADWLLFDCRFDLADPEAGGRAYSQGHLPGAVYIHLDEDLAGPRGPDTGRHPLPDLDEFAGKLQRWGVNGERQLVAYDGGPGAMAVRFWWLARHLGLTSVAVMSGGYGAWEREGRPIQRETPPSPPGRFTPVVRGDDAVDVDTLRRRLQAGESVLLDARDASRYRGEREPIDAKAGHVPGALNRPFVTNLDKEGEFRSPEALRGEFDELLAGLDPAEVVHMCGSGVTACHNLLAMEHAGLPGSKLYVGSWSHWITDPERPVATGEEHKPE